MILDNNFGIQVEVPLSLEFSTTKNPAEYEVVIAWMILDEELGWNHIKLRIDSQLVVFQIRGEAQAKDPLLQWYLKLDT